MATAEVCRRHGVSSAKSCWGQSGDAGPDTLDRAFAPLLWLSADRSDSVEREGITMNHKKRRRLCKEEGVAGEATAWPQTGERNARAVAWAGPRLKTLEPRLRTGSLLASPMLLRGQFSRLLYARMSGTGGRFTLSENSMARELIHCNRFSGRPDTIVADIGTELTIRAILKRQNLVCISW